MVIIKNNNNKSNLKSSYKKMLDKSLSDYT